MTEASVNRRVELPDVTVKRAILSELSESLSLTQTCGRDRESAQTPKISKSHETVVLAR